MIRVLCLAGGLVGAVGLSQFPEFSQQYLQRLGGQVDALTIVVKDFDASALNAGLGREEALEQLEGTTFLDGRQADMRRTFARHTRLNEDLTAIRNASPLQRMTMPHRFADPATMQAVWADFTPAVPVSVAGAASAGTGFLGGWLLLAAAINAFTSAFRRLGRKPSAGQMRREPGLRRDPPVARPTLVSQSPSHLPKLAGAQR